MILSRFNFHATQAIGRTPRYATPLTNLFGRCREVTISDAGDFILSPPLSLPSTTIMLRSALTKTVLNTATRPSGAAIRPIIARAYHEKVISHYESPRNVCLFSLFLGVCFRVGYLIADSLDLGWLFEQERL